MTVLTVNRRHGKNMYACFLRHTISNKTLECHFKVHVNVIPNIQKEHEKSYRFFEHRLLFKHVNLFKQTFTKLSSTFKIEKRGTSSATMHVTNSGWGTPILKIYHKKKRNPTSIQHNFVFSCSKGVKLSYQRHSFC